MPEENATMARQTPDADWAAFTLASPSGAELLVRHRPANGTPRGTVHILHGLAEHSERYGAFAADLSALGFHVVAHDHRGHGGTTAPDAPPRRFAARKGGEAVLADCAAVSVHARGLCPDRPLVLFGHSMGAFLGANIVAREGHGFSGAALWNASPHTGAALLAVRAMLRLERALKGSDVASEMFANLTFDVWAKAVKNRRMSADWLSHDAQAVDRYVADPLCGWTPTVSMAEDLLGLIASSAAVTQLGPVPESLPLHVAGGTADPSTRGAATIRAFAERLARRGASDVTLAVIEGARHETLNELPAAREAVMASLVAWLDRIAP